FFAVPSICLISAPRSLRAARNALHCPTPNLSACCFQVARFARIVAIGSSCSGAFAMSVYSPMYATLRTGELYPRWILLTCLTWIVFLSPRTPIYPSLGEAQGGFSAGALQG